MILDRRRKTGPDFICIGSSRCGTTSLYRHLRMHPQLWLPPIKEIHYFGSRSGQRNNHRWNRWTKKHALQLINTWIYGRNTSLEKIYADATFSIKYLTGARNDEWYKSLFSVPRTYVSGEITPSYCVLTESEVSFIAQKFPDIKIIFLMRDPIKRCWSSVTKAFVRREKRKIEDVSFDEIYQHLNSWGVHALTSYDQIIKKWESCIPNDNIFYGFLDEFHETPEIFLSRLYEFLQVKKPKETFMKLRRVNDTSKIQTEIPFEIKKYIAEKYMPMVKMLETRFKTYPGRWRREMELIVIDKSNHEEIT